MTEVVLPPLARDLAHIVLQVMTEIRPRLIAAAVEGDRGETENTRHADNFLSVHDIWMHRRYQELLADVLESFVYASEEADPMVIGEDRDPDLCVLVDPLDTSELAVRGLNGYTHLMVYSRRLARPVVAVVGDIFHHVQLYVGARDEAGHDKSFAITADNRCYRLGPHAPKALCESLITNYSMRPAERFVPLAQQRRLIHALGGGGKRGRIGVDFGSIGLCHVASGFTDAMVEFAKGFAIWDLAPGHYILHAAGGTVLDLERTILGLDYKLGSIDAIADAMNTRQKFVAAGSAALAQELIDTLD